MAVARYTRVAGRAFCERKGDAGTALGTLSCCWPLLALAAPARAGFEAGLAAFHAEDYGAASAELTALVPGLYAPATRSPSTSSASATT
ncbi:MAG: hypothetical protein V3S87_10775, partial [Alphaproteobacteria bacterium]